METTFKTILATMVGGPIDGTDIGISYPPCDYIIFPYGSTESGGPGQIKYARMGDSLLYEFVEEE